MSTVRVLAEGGLRVAVIELELVGGECLVLALYPVKDAAYVQEAVHGACGATADTRVDIEPAIAWRACMVSDYFDAGQRRRL